MSSNPRHPLSEYFGSSAPLDFRVCYMLGRISPLLTIAGSILLFAPPFHAAKPAPLPLPVQGSCTSAETGKSCSATFFLQPYKGVKMSVAGTAVKPRFSRTDKTQALAQVTIANVPADASELLLTVENGLTGARREVRVSLVDNPATSVTPLIVIDAPAAQHRFLHRIATGKQPKSAMFISPTRVILPLLDDNHIEVVDVLTREVSRLTVPPQYAKRGGFVESVVVPPRGEVWVSQMAASAIHRYALDTLEYRGSIDLSGSWTKVLAFNPVENTVYASNWNSSDISVVSVESLKELRKIKLGGVPRGMAFSTDGTTMLAAIFGGKNDSDGAGRTAMVDLEKQKITKTIIAGGSHRHAVRLKSGENYFAVSDMARNKVYFINEYAKTAEVKVYSNPNTIAESPDGKFLYVSCRGHNNPKSYLLKGPDFGRLMVIDIATLKVIEDLEAGNQPTGLDVSPDGKYVVLTDFLDHAMRVYERVQ